MHKGKGTPISDTGPILSMGASVIRHVGMTRLDSVYSHDPIQIQVIMVMSLYTCALRPHAHKYVAIRYWYIHAPMYISA